MGFKKLDQNLRGDTRKLSEFREISDDAVKARSPELKTADVSEE